MLYSELMRAKVKDVLNKKVKFLYRPTNRWRTGTIQGIKQRYLLINHANNVVTTVSLADVHWEEK